MKEFITFAGIPTMPSETAKVPNNSSTTNAAEQNNEYIRDQYIREEIEKHLKEMEKKGEKATKKKIKKIVKKAIKKDEEKRQKADANSKKTNTDTAIEVVKTFFSKIGKAIVKTIPTVLVTVVGIAAKSFFGRIGWFSNKRKGATI